MTVQPPPWQSLDESFRMHWHSEADAVGVVIGCSGGADSVALTRLIDQAHRTAHSEAWRSQASPRPDDPSGLSSRVPPVVIAHFNHGLRGHESDGDETLVRDLAASLDRRFVVGTPRESIQVRSDESTLRDQRREFFVEVARQQGCRYIAVAHTADDQAETVLHHILRGTGPAGLAGMKPVTPIAGDFVLRRPLLATRRDDIRNALIAIDQPWREDASNQDSRYTRNWLRNDVMPVLRDRIPSVNESLVRLARNQAMTQDLLLKLAFEWLDAFSSVRRDEENRRTLLIQRPSRFIQRPSRFIQRPSRSLVDTGWPHDASLAEDSTVILNACQNLFDREGIPRGAMDQANWLRLTEWILDEHFEMQNRVSLGHLPGHIEVFASPDHIELAVPDVS